MIKHKSVIEIIKSEKIYQFLCDGDSPLGEVYDCLGAMQQHVLQIMNTAQKKEETPPEPTGEGSPCPIPAN